MALFAPKLKRHVDDGRTRRGAEGALLALLAHRAQEKRRTGARTGEGVDVGYAPPRDGLACENINTRLRTATTLLRALRDIGEPAGPTNPEAIRVAWRTGQSELDLNRRFAIF